MAEKEKTEYNTEIDAVLRDTEEEDVQEFIEELNPEMARNDELADNGFQGYEGKDDKSC